MKISGKDFIKSIVSRLKKSNRLTTDSNILAEIRSLSYLEINEILILGAGLDQDILNRNLENE